MDDEQNRTPPAIVLLRYFATTFSVGILAFCLVGIIGARFGGNTLKMPSLYISNAGLSFGTILQMALFALITSVLALILFSDIFITKIRLLYRALFFALLTMLSASVIAIIFKWFNAANIKAWIVFLLLFLAGFSIGWAFTLLKLKLEKKKLDRLLENYKSQYREPLKTTII